MPWWVWRWLSTAGSNVGIVEPGRVYRSAALSERELRAAVEEWGLRTVLDLRIDRDGAPPEIQGVTMRQIGLDDHGAVDVALVEACAAMLADHAAQPILLHCQGGRHRTGVVVAVYRVKYCGWTAERARKEANYYGFYRFKHDAWADYLEALQ
jgi:tyrosine-protein phosphatase SIW14